MSATEFGSFSLLLLLLISSAHLVGHVFTRIGQPRVVGEIVAGVLTGPSVLGHLVPELSSAILFGGSSGRLEDVS